MSDKPEPIFAILADMRDFCSGWSEDVDVTVKVGRIYGWACRLKEAAERQEDRRRDEVLSLQRTIVKMQDAIARQADAVNAAAMREALEKIRHEYGWGRIGCRTCVSSEADVERVSDLFEKQIDAALAAPARNCDVSRGTNETIERCLASLNVESSSASFDAGVCAAIGWMLAAPAEGGVE